MERHAPGAADKMRRDIMRGDNSEMLHRQRPGVGEKG